ncbi:hypothetical protein ACLB2K_040937 [Fragaria x ananassa]
MNVNKNKIYSGLPCHRRNAYLYSHGAFLWSLEKHLPDVALMIFHHGEVGGMSVYKFHDWSMGRGGLEGEGEGRDPCRGQQTFCFPVEGGGTAEMHPKGGLWLYNNSMLILDYDGVSDPRGCFLNLLEVWVSVKGLRVVRVGNT